MEKVTSIRKTSQLVSIDAAGAPPTLIYALSQGRTAKIKKIMLMNNTTVNDTIIFGEGAAGAWTPGMPAIYILTPFDEQLGEWEIPQHEFATDIYAISAGAGAGTTLDVMIEVEEVG